MTPFIYFDSEDNSKELLDAGRSGFDKTVTQIAALTSDGETSFYNRGDAKKFLAWLDSRPESVVYAHNLGYDLGNLFGNEFGKHLYFQLVGGRLISARGCGKLWLDSFNIWPMALAKLGQAFGLEKFTGRRMATDREYVFRDCEIGRQAMLFAADFAARYRVDKLPQTLGGLCVKVFQRMNLKNCHDASLFARAGLYGGRVELFSTGAAGSIFYTDINSLYPSAMLEKYPMLAGRQKDLDGWGVAHVTVSIPEMDIAPLPYRRSDGAVEFPCGTIRGVWTYHEIFEAERLGAKILKVHRCYGSRQGETFYAPFVNRIYADRLRATSDAESLMLKLLMNNLYGRLVIRGDLTSNVKGTMRLKSYAIPLPEFTNYLHGAYVTSYGRLALGRYLRRVPAEKLIYCDTDSLIFESRKLPFPVSKKLGEMKLEGRATYAATFAPKVYQFGETIKAKGVPRDLAQAYARGEAVSVSQPYKIREVCNMLTEGKKGKRLSVWRIVQKRRQSGYNKKDLRGGRYYPIFRSTSTKRRRKEKQTGKEK